MLRAAGVLLIAKTLFGKNFNSLYFKIFGFVEHRVTAPRARFGNGSIAAWFGRFHTIV